MKFSICIPNFNYGRYLAQTINSVLSQNYTDFEIIISDNASTDNSVAIVQAIGDPRIKVHVNAINVGFSANLDKAAQLATGDFIVMLSSDDVMLPNALKHYAQLIEHLGAQVTRAVLCSGQHVIDGKGKQIGQQLRLAEYWPDASYAQNASDAVQAPVYAVPARDPLIKAVRQLRNPLYFAPTMCSRQLHREVEGYLSNKLMSPDKWFNWKILYAAETAYFIDAPLFGYRVHESNQLAQQKDTQALKYEVDQYTYTLQLDDTFLHALHLSRADIVRAFVNNDIGRNGLSMIARGHRQRARRILHFAFATYPAESWRSAWVWLLRIALFLGPLSTLVGKLMRRRFNRNPTSVGQESSLTS